MESKPVLSVTMLLTALVVAGCTAQDYIVEAHNEMVEIHNQMKDQLNVAVANEVYDVKTMGTVMSTVSSRMEAIDISNCPADYQARWNDLIQHQKKVLKALETEDQQAVDIMFDQYADLMERLNATAEVHGVEMIRNNGKPEKVL